MPTLLLSRRSAAASLATASLAVWLRRPLLALDERAPDERAPDEASTGTEPATAASQPLPYLDRIGLQLYTVRNQMAENREATLQAVADAGYRQVELMSIDADAIQIAAIARDKGMMVHSAFLDFNVIAQPDREGTASVAQTLEFAERIGLRHVVFGYLSKDQRDTADKCRAIADRANAAADLARSSGLRMCYHNHAFEFGPFADANPDAAKAEGAGPTTAMEIFANRFDPHKMEFELDVFWAKIAGQDPIEWMRRLAGRISQVHLKDLKPETPVIFNEGEVPVDAFEELGDGVIDIAAVMRLAREIGVDQCHVEQDQSPAPLESIRQSAQFLKGTTS